MTTVTEELDRDFEDVAPLVVDWMRGNGFPDAGLTEDAGVGAYDVDSANAIAEVNIGAPPARPNVQRLDEVARSVGRRALYFSLRGFTASAVEWADNVGIALFEFDKDGDSIIPSNGSADELTRKPPSAEERLLEAAARAVATGLEELHEEVQLRGADEETATRIREARDRKRMRRDLLG